MQKIFNYAEIEPEENEFVDICADITHQCNMTCKNCYIPGRDIPDMDLDRFKDFMSRLGGRAFIRIIGAEPTVAPQCAEFIRAVYEHGRTNGRKHSCTLVTNGLRLSHKKYLDTLFQAGLRSVTLSLNGVDNDDWYEQIDEMRCASKKIKALRNIVDRKMNLNTGTIIIPEINREAPARLLEVIEREKINNVMMRIKNVGQLGRYQKDAVDNIKMDGLVKLCSDQFNVSEDYIWSFHDVPYYNKFNEPNTILFPLNEKDKMFNRGRWVKITNWDTENDGGIPDPGSKRRGRITQDFRIAPFYEHAKENEGGY
jgi:molybdenum cofactor biosynthesis enzyme MoaA